MAKRLFLLLISNIIGFMFGANYLSATDTVVTKAPGSDAVQTMIIEPEIVENEIIPESSVVIASEYVVPVVPKHYIITMVTNEIVQKPNYQDIYRTGKFLYAHDESYLFGNLLSFQVGDTFMITESGITRNYQVMDIGIYELVGGYLNGSKQVTKDVELLANGYDISMMTCYGTHYGNGKASHRFVIFANEI